VKIYVCQSHSLCDSCNQAPQCYKGSELDRLSRCANNVGQIMILICFFILIVTVELNAA
jgi:hypothetical protein